MKGRKIKWKISLKGACKPLTYLRKWQSTQGSLWGTSTGKHIHVCSPSHFVSSDSRTKHCPFSVPRKIQMQDFIIWKEAHNRLLHTPSSHTHKRHLSCLPECRMAKGILVPQKRFCMYKESQQIQNSRPGSTSIKTSPSRPTTSVRFQMATVPAFLSRTKALLFSPPVSKA